MSTTDTRPRSATDDAPDEHHRAAGKVAGLPGRGVDPRRTREGRR
ncbi:hypothetical protein [Nocardia rhamnosiphila]|uniref:Uncharacterized protein n=1 Tax=Nocardia rhamnosiphila TaxID=426716 RepID=A0ABV2WJQ4_9NOCA